MNKKASMMFTIVTIILAVIAIGTILFTWSSAYGAGKYKFGEQMCKSSVDIRVNHQMNINGNMLAGTIKPPLKCSTITREISGTREELIQQVSYHMARCWWMFGEGKYEELLKGSSVVPLPAVLGFDELKNKCFNCYTLLIDQDKIEGGAIPAKEIVDYMYKNNYANTGTTYLNYIQNYGGPGRVAFAAPEVFPRTAYSISMMPKNKEDSKFWTGVSQLGVSAIGGGVIGVGIATIENLKNKDYVSPDNRMTGKAALVGKAVPLLAIGAIALIGSVQAYLGYAGFKNVMATMYKERDVSSIYFGFLAIAQNQCSSGNLDEG